MLTLRNTPKLAGVEMSGDFLDLENLYSALHTVAGDEGEFRPYKGARLRVLGVCYDLRHAFMGDREVEFVPNGMNEDTMKLMGLITPDKNLYYKCYVYYPEVLFVTMALNDFIRLYAKKRAKTAAFPLLDKTNMWDSSIANVRVFQAEVAKCLQEAVTEASFKRMMNLMHNDYPWTDDYAIQYLDMLNIRYLHLESYEERQKALSAMVKRMVDKGKEYQLVEQEAKAMARENHCLVEDISWAEDYPEVEW